MMKLISCALLGLAALLLESPALAGTCSIHATGPVGGWKFVQAHDVAKHKIVLSQAIKSGDSKTVTVSGDQVRVDWKLAGHAHYRAGAVNTCKQGNVIRV